MFSINRRRRHAEIFMVSLSFFLVLLSGIRLAGLKRDAEKKETQAFAFSELPVPDRIEAPQDEETAVPELAGQTASTPLYVVRLVGSELRLIPGGQTESYTVLPSADPRTFREADRERLIEGIKIYSYEALAELMEDFSS